MPQEGANIWRNHPSAVYTEAEMELLAAMERYQKLRHRLFPSFTEVMRVLYSLGYRKTERHVELPDYPARPGQRP